VAFRRGGAKKRRDANEPAIVDALRAVGCEVWQVSGRGLPDLLIRVHGAAGGRWQPLEVKTPKGTLTAAQGDLRWPVVRSVDEALALVGVRSEAR
jgi:hypothetical protein